jgi:predicted dehydrogenase/nucleoside-diphosphate-sugar epimerase
MTQTGTAEATGENAQRSGQPSAKRRVAFLGAGYIADWHAKSIATVRNVELVAVCDSALPRAKALAAKYGVPRTYASLAELLAGETLDAVHILLPPDRHFAAARAVLEAGVGVFLEKPMCDNPADCDALVLLAAQRGLRLGVGHNFLFSGPYEQLRQDVRGGVLGRILDVTITWHRPLPQIVHGPFDAWMLRNPRNILIEIGSHSVAHMLDLVGEPAEMRTHAWDAVELPTGQQFFRRWQVDAAKDQTTVQLRFSFVPGFSEYTLHVRGSLAAGTVDLERNTYTLQQHRPCDQDFDNYAMVLSQAKQLQRQARRTLTSYVLAKLHLRARGNPYGESIAKAMDAFYNAEQKDERLDGAAAAKVVRVCEQMALLASLPQEGGCTKAERVAMAPLHPPAKEFAAPRILILGGTGFIGQELVRQMVKAGHSIRLLVRNASSIPAHLLAAGAECQTGDLMNRADVLRAMEGMDCVFDLARANVKSWADYQEFEIGATRRVAECALEAGVKRLIYTGTIDSYYAGRKAGTITEQTPLDPRIGQRNLYARAKAASEELLLGMHREQGLPVVILRPGIVIGRGGSPFHWGVGMWWNEAVCQTWGNGNHKLPLVLVEDVAQGLIAAMASPGIEGRSFNLVADPCLSAQEYLDELDRCGGFRVQRIPTPIARFFLLDLIKWAVKVAVRHPERRLPSYRDWESRTQHARFDCTAAKTTLGWRPASGRDEMVRRGIEEPLMDLMK